MTNTTPEHAHAARNGKDNAGRTHLRLVKAPTTTESPAKENHVVARKLSVRNTILSHLDDPEAAPVAAAFVTLRQDGAVDIIAADIEPEFADAIAEGLDALHQRVRWHSQIKKRDNPPHGFYTLAIIIPVALAIAAYINHINWLDSVITLAASLFAPSDGRDD